MVHKEQQTKYYLKYYWFVRGIVSGSTRSDRRMQIIYRVIIEYRLRLTLQYISRQEDYGTPTLYWNSAPRKNL